MINQYERLEIEQSEAGVKAMFAAHSTSSNARTSLFFPLCRQTGHTASACREFDVSGVARLAGSDKGAEKWQEWWKPQRK